MKSIPENICHAIYDVLVEHAGAIKSQDERDVFVSYYSDLDGYKPTEFRCCGRWGVAGKFWWNDDRFYVSGRSRCECKNEDEFEKELQECDEVNSLLVPIYEEFNVAD